MEHKGREPGGITADEIATVHSEGRLGLKVGFCEWEAACADD